MTPPMTPRTAAGRAHAKAWDDYRTAAKVAHVWAGSDETIYQAVLPAILAIEAEAADASHPRTYSLTASGPHGELFLVTDDESGIQIGHAKQIGGPLTAPTARALLAAEPAGEGLREALRALVEAVGVKYNGNGLFVPDDLLPAFDKGVRLLNEIGVQARAVLAKVEEGL